MEIAIRYKFLLLLVLYRKCLYYKHLTALKYKDNFAELAHFELFFASVFTETTYSFVFAGN